MQSSLRRSGRQLLLSAHRSAAIPPGEGLRVDDRSEGHGAPCAEGDRREIVSQATIMKPAVMIGTEDRILNTWAHLAKKWSFLPIIGDGSTKIQPVYVVDVAAAIVAALKDDGSSMGKLYELGGPDVYTVHELAELMYEMIREYPHYIKVPLTVAKAIATPRELFLNRVPFPLPTPHLFNLDQIKAFSVDTVVSKDALTFENLGVEPHKLNGYPVFLISYRKGGPAYGSTVSGKVTDI